MDQKTKKDIALHIVGGKQTITSASNQYSTSRKFIAKQVEKANQSIDKAFEEKTTESGEKILFFIPVTKQWLCMVAICLILYGRCPYRGVIVLFKILFDYDISLGTIHNITERCIQKAKAINDKEDLSRIKLAAPDEKFHGGLPILSGTDIRSLYCYLLSKEQERDGDTWAIHLWDLQKKGFDPERFIADGGTGLRAGHALAFPNTPCDYDNFHIVMDMKNLRRFYRNRFKTATTEVKKQEEKLAKAQLKGKKDLDQTPLAQAKAEQKKMAYLSSSIDTLVSWMQHDVLYMAGYSPEDRSALYDFIVDEFRMLEAIEPHRIKAIRVLLENQKELALAFVEVLDQKFTLIANSFKRPLETIWEMCRLMRCDIGSDNYAIRSLPLQDTLGSQFDDIEDAVIGILETTERTSSMAENLHSRIHSHLFLRKQVDNGFLNLLRFFFNHKPILRSVHEYRQGKTPTEILTGKSHPHLLEMLGFEPFKRAA